MVTVAVGSPREARRTVPLQLNPRICLRVSSPTRFNVRFRQHADVSLLRPPVAPVRGYGFFTVCPSGVACRLALRSRLTLIRLALIRNPWSCGVEVSRLHYRYLCLHLLFRLLQQGSRLTFCG